MPAAPENGEMDMSLRTMVFASAIACVAAAGAAHANDAARFELANTSGQNIDVIQVSPVSSDNWGPDLLGQGVLPTGYLVTVTPGGEGCRYDVRVIYHDKSKEWFRNVDLCKTGRISFANSKDYVQN